jgi:PTH2 family peptidyl-tRNA hydrolase
MPPGKLASQAVHAARISLLRYIKRHPWRLHEFLDLNSCGSAVTLNGRNLADLERAWGQARAAGLPCALFTDSGHVFGEHFSGAPIVTALAIGPAGRGEMRQITKRFQCV